MMKRKSLILAGLAVAVPLAAALHVKTVQGSEPPGRLVVNGDGTVTDTVTKLIWQQATTGIYQGSVGPTSCSTLSIGTHTTGWRLPNIKELVSTVDYESATSPMIDTAAFPGTASAGYWTSEGPSNASAYTVSFATGQVVAPGGCCGTVNVRCVHSSP
jgi:hypothetical protein